MSDEPKKSPRTTDGKFAKGQPAVAPAVRRRAGVPNKITRDIRQGVIDGFARHGSDGKGSGGFSGYCFYLAKRYPKSAAKLIERILPMQINGTGFNATIGSVNLVSIPSDRFLSGEDLARMQAGEPMVIEHQRQDDDDKIAAPTNDDAA